MTHIKFDRGLSYASDVNLDERPDIMPDDDPPPCDSCSLKSHCAAEAVACTAFIRWVGSGREQYRRPGDVPDAAKMDRAMRL